MLRYKVSFQLTHSHSRKTHTGQFTVWDNPDWSLGTALKCTLLEMNDDTVGISEIAITNEQLRALRWGEQVDLFSSNTPESALVWGAEEMPDPEPCPPVNFALFPFCEEWETTVSAPAIAA